MVVERRSIAGRIASSAIVVLLAACARGSEGVPSGGSEGSGAGGATTSSTGSGGRGGGSTVTSTGTGSGGDTTTSSTGTGIPAQACPTGEFVTSIDGAGKIICSSLDEASRNAINEGCSVYFGWRDNCDGCTYPPTKWGRISGTTCDIGVGTKNVCTTPTLGGDSVRLFGLGPDGDLDGNDKLYVGFHCGTGASASAPGPCKPGELVTGIEGSTVTCAPVSGAVLGFVRQSCSLYFGWQDSCNGCGTAPPFWGRVNAAACKNGAGTNSCTTAVLGSETVNLFGLDPNGNVDDNDMFYVGLHCTEATPASGPAAGLCPAGQFVVGTLAGGGVQCESPASLVRAYFGAHCRAYLGWQDKCSG